MFSRQSKPPVVVTKIRRAASSSMTVIRHPRRTPNRHSGGWNRVKKSSVAAAQYPPQTHGSSQAQNSPRLKHASTFAHKTSVRLNETRGPCSYVRPLVTGI